MAATTTTLQVAERETEIYDFDSVLGVDFTQKEVYDSKRAVSGAGLGGLCVVQSCASLMSSYACMWGSAAAGKPMVASCLSGYNCSILTYGQMGSGKNYTRWGELSVPGSSSDRPAYSNIQVWCHLCCFTVMSVQIEW